MNIPEVQMIMHLTKDVPDRLLRAADEINVRTTMFKQVVMIVSRADIRSNVSDSRSSHSAFLAGHFKRPQSLPLTVARDDHYCHRFLIKGHLAQICPAPAPHPDAFTNLQKYLALPKKQFNKHKMPETNEINASHSVVFYRRIGDAGSSDHISPDFKNFLGYFPIVPELVRFGNGATGYARGRGTIC